MTSNTGDFNQWKLMLLVDKLMLSPLPSPVDIDLGPGVGWGVRMCIMEAIYLVMIPIHCAVQFNSDCTNLLPVVMKVTHCVT